MTKSELLSTYTAEQLAEMVVKLENVPTIEDYELKLPIMQRKNEQLQSEVEKYRKAFEDAKNELKDLEIKIEEEYKPFEIEVERLRKNECELSEENAKLYSKIEKSGDITDFLPTEPIKVADMLIHNYKQGLYPVYAKDNKGQIQNIEVDGKIYPLETGEYEEYSEVRQIAEHFLVYCNHNGEVEE